MSLQNLSQEKLEATSLLELAHYLLKEEQQEMDFNTLYDRVTDWKDYTEEAKNNYLGQFYTDLTMDGRFLTSTPGMWGLKRWYPVDQMDEVAATTTRKKEQKKEQKKQDKTKTKKSKKQPEPPREEEPEREPDSPGDGVEVLTAEFEESAEDDETPSDTSDINEGFDDPVRLAEEEEEDAEEDESDY